MTKRVTRHASMRSALLIHRRQAEFAVRSGIRQERTDPITSEGDLLERTDAQNQRDLEHAVVQMRAETLVRINEALARLDAGERYGLCAECEGEIAEQRLAALPFAVRCLECAERHEKRRTGQASALTGTLPPSPFLPPVWP